VFETTNKEPHASTDDAADDGGDDAVDYETVDKNVRAFARINFLTIASPYVTPYLFNKWYLNKHYGIRGNGDRFIIGDSAVRVDASSDVNINDKSFSWTKGLWVLLSRKKWVNTQISTKDLKRYKNILEITKAYLVGYESGGEIQISRGPKFANVISKLVPQSKRHGIESELRGVG
jgi:hypothetical protein